MGGEDMKAVRRPAMKLALVAAVVITAIAGLYLFDAQRKRAAAAQTGTETEAVPVVVHRLETQARQQTIEAVGTVVADQQVMVASEVAGRVTRIHFSSGESVKAGAPLLQINDAAQSKELERHRAAAQLAEVKLERARQLQGHSMSRADFEQHVTAQAQSAALVAQTEAEIALRRPSAPFAGEIGIRRVSLGQYVEAGTAIATLTDLKTLHVDFNVPERYRALLAPGLAVHLAGDGAQQAPAKARITAIDAHVDAARRAVAVRATLDAPDKGHWWPGAFARVRVQLPDGPEALQIPAIAVTSSLAGQSVFVVRKDGVRDLARLMPVAGGENRAGNIAVPAGDLQAGDLVVVAGQINLQNNTPVRWRMQHHGSATPANTAAAQE